MLTFELDDNIKKEIEDFKLALAKTQDPSGLLRSGLISDSMQAMGEKLLLAAELDPFLLLPLDAWAVLGGATVLDPLAKNVDEATGAAVRSGATRVSFAATEESSGGDWDALTTATDGADKMTGTKMWITGAGDADAFVVLAREGGTDGKLATWFTSDLDHITVTPIETDQGLSVYKVEFDGAAAIRLGGMGLAVKAITRGRLAITYGAAGVIKKLRALATEYASTRQSGGKAIVHKQSVHFKIADIKVMEEGSYRTAQRIARIYDTDSKAAGTMAVAAKLFASEGIRKSLGWAIEIQGASAFTGSQGVGQYLPLVHTWPTIEGSDDLLRGQIADEALRATGNYDY